MSAPAEGARASRLVSVLAGLAVGATAWVSLGVVALVDPARMTRVGALPPVTWLSALLLAGGGAGALLGPRLWRAPLVLLVLPWLPWMPWTTPGAFLLWDGPLEGGVWGVALAAALWPLLRTVPVGGTAAWTQSPRRAPWLAAVCFAGLALTAWAVARPRVPAGDEPHYLVITQSLIKDGDLRIENNHRDQGYLAYYDTALKPDFMRRGTDRQIYSIHAPGVSALVLPAFAVFGYPGAVATVIALAAVGLAAAWRLAFLLTGSAGAAWIGWASVAVAAPTLLHAYTIYPDPIGGALAIAGVGALVALDLGLMPRPAAWVGIGAALAVLPWLHTRFALIAGVLGAAIVLRLAVRRNARAVVGFLSLPMVSALSWFAFFYAIYGTPNPAAPYGSRPEGGLSFIPTGVAGLLFDQQFGLVANAPVLGLAFVGVVVLALERRRLAIELVAVGLSYLAVAASYPMWWGGYSAPARFVVVLVPLCALPIATLWARSGSGARLVVLALLTVSAAMSAALVGVDRGSLIYNGRDGYGLLLDWLSRSADLTLALPSVHRDGGALAVGDAAVWAVAAMGVGAAALLVGRLAPRAGAAAAFAAVPLTVMLACGIVWSAGDRDVLTPSTSQMSWLKRWDPQRAPLTLQLAPTRLLAVDDAPTRLNIGTSVRGRRGGAAEPLLRIPELPAGEYDLFVEGRRTLGGEVTVRLGRQDLPMERWRLDDRPPGFTGLVLRLPVAAHSITVSGDDSARSSVRRMTLRPRGLVTRDTSQGALRAARYGAVVVFALDDMAYMEPGALWVRGEQTAAFVVRADAGRAATLRLTAGPVPNDVQLAAGAWTRTVALAAGQVVDVALPAEALAPQTLLVTSGTGFRPSEHGPSGDVRRLGVFLTWPGEAAPAGAAAVP